MNFLIFFIAVAILFVILKLIALPFKIIIKLMINAFIGGAVLFLVNLVGARFGLVLDINWITALIVGFLGVPGVIIVLILHFLL